MGFGSTVGVRSRCRRRRTGWCVIWPSWPKSRVAVTRGNISYPSYPPHSVIPEITKPMGCQFGVAHRALNMAVPPKMLHGAGITALVRAVKAPHMAAPMLVYQESEPVLLARCEELNARGWYAWRE